MYTESYLPAKLLVLAPVPPAYLLQNIIIYNFLCRCEGDTMRIPLGQLSFWTVSIVQCLEIYNLTAKLPKSSPFRCAPRILHGRRGDDTGAV